MSAVQMTVQAASRKEREAEIARAIVDFMQKRLWRSIRMQRTVIPGQFQTGEPGITDYLFLHYEPVLVLWVEVKAPDGHLRPQQREWIDRERARGATVWIAADIGAYEEAYAEKYGWLHDGTHPGQVEMYMGTGAALPNAEESRGVGGTK